MEDSLLDERVITVLVSIVTAVSCVTIHYEGLSGFTRLMNRGTLPHRARIAVLICGQLLLHCLHIWVFAVAYFVLFRFQDFGGITTQTGEAAATGMFDVVYYSATVFTTIGFGDLIPTGPVRFLTGLEGVTGLVLITWSASFTFLEMQRHWNRG